MSVSPTSEVARLNLLGDALDGSRGGDQQRIARVGLEWITLLLGKNSDYGGSAWQVPVLAPECSVDTAIRVRMSDKLHRLATLLGGKQPSCEESIRDTITDLGAYCLLWLAVPEQGGASS